MPFHSLRHWSYLNNLKALLKSKQRAKSDTFNINPAQSFLFLFNGTDTKDVNFFRSLHTKLVSRGIKPKMLAFVQSKVDVHDFGMALYNEASIKWNYLPKPKLVELVQSREFDILFHINPEELTHLHFLAVASNAKFKISTMSGLPNDFKLTVKTKDQSGLPKIYRQMNDCMETLAV